MQGLPKDYLDSMVSFWSSVGAASDWSKAWSNIANVTIQNYYRRCKSPEELDAFSIGIDWASVGHDLENALKEIEQKELAAAE